MLSGDASVAEGHEGAFYQMLRRFSSHWDRIDVICPRPAQVARTQVHGNVFLHPSPWPKALQPLFILQRGRELLSEQPYGLISSHDFGFFYNGIGAWLLTRGHDAPYVSEIHHVEGYPRAVTTRERLYRAAAMIYLRRVWRCAAAIRTVNRHEVPDLLRRLGVPEEKILYLPALYLDYEVFRPMPGTPHRTDVLFVGRLVPNKGLFTLLNAIAQVRQTHPAVTLLILGRGPLRRALEDRVEALGLRENVTFVERVAHPQGVAELYNAAGMLVCASTTEGGPRVTVEAMACGTPVISTPVGVMPDLIEHGTNGLLFHWDAGELAGHIRRLLDDPALRERLGAAGREAVQGFDAETLIARYAASYKELADRHRERR